ncbi:biotin--[acetyl-CoA-carboxylase] ligase [Thermovibrio sp.]
MKIEFLKEVDSTNLYLKRVKYEPFLAVVAKKQTKGRGRRGRSWLSEEEKGLYFSMMFPPLKKNLTLTGPAFGYGVLRTLRKLSKEFYLKWPNDVYIRGKKIAGILPELLKDRLIVGVGINLKYKEEELSILSVPATSLYAEGIDFREEELIRELYKNLTKIYEELSLGKFKVEKVEKVCPLIGKEVKVIEGEKVYNATALGIDRDGALIVETEGKVKRLFSAEVSIREVR